MLKYVIAQEKSWSSVLVSSKNIERFLRYHDLKFDILATGGAVPRNWKILKIQLRGHFLTNSNKPRLYSDSFEVKESKFDIKKTVFHCLGVIIHSFMKKKVPKIPQVQRAVEKNCLGLQQWDHHHLKAGDLFFLLDPKLLIAYVRGQHNRGKQKLCFLTPALKGILMCFTSMLLP